MDVVNYMFCDIRERESFETWPFTRDLRQGVLPGLRYIPQYRDIGENDYNRLTAFPTSGLPAPEGLLPQHANVSAERGALAMLLLSAFWVLTLFLSLARALLPLLARPSLPFSALQKRGIWHILDTRFDGLVGNCECLDNRDMPDMAFTVHFSCMAVFSKPGHFSSDFE